MFLATDDASLRPAIIALNMLMGKKSVIDKSPVFDLANKYKPKYLISKNKTDCNKVVNTHPYIKTMSNYEPRSGFFPNRHNPIDVHPSDIAIIDTHDVDLGKKKRVIEHTLCYTSNVKIYCNPSYIQGVKTSLVGGNPEFIYSNAKICVALNEEQAYKIMWLNKPCCFEGDMEYTYDIDDIPSLLENANPIQGQKSRAEDHTYWDIAADLLAELNEFDLQDQIIEQKIKYLGELTSG